VSGWTSTRYTDNCSTVCPHKHSAWRSSPVSYGIQRLWLLSVCHPRIRATLGIHLFGVAENGENGRVPRRPGLGEVGLISGACRHRGVGKLVS
jgi:hypothetical protein